VITAHFIKDRPSMAFTSARCVFFFSVQFNAAFPLVIYRVQPTRDLSSIGLSYSIYAAFPRHSLQHALFSIRCDVNAATEPCTIPDPSRTNYTPFFGIVISASSYYSQFPLLSLLSQQKTHKFRLFGLLRRRVHEIE
jgi:hypothetical protein